MTDGKPYPPSPIQADVRHRFVIDMTSLDAAGARTRLWQPDRLATGFVPVAASSAEFRPIRTLLWLDQRLGLPTP
jgi:hypothetical protein